MGSVTCSISMSLDGFVAGPDPDQEHPLGVGGQLLHEWAFAARSFHEQHGETGGQPGADSDVLAEVHGPVGAIVMGRKMFSGGSGPWDGDLNPNGWWGEDPPFHAPVFVLTHHQREPKPMQGGTEFRFVTDGPASAVQQARAAAGDRAVLVAGGGNAVRQCAEAGLLDELQAHVVPILLGAGTRLVDHLGGPIRLERLRVIDSPAVTHVKYRVLP